MSLLNSRLLPTVLLASAAVLLAGCIERSAVVKVNKDGSGVVHIRHHEQPVEINLGGSKKKTSDAEKENPLPSQERLDELIATLGSGVKLVAATETKNRNGWNGYEIVVRFDDINQLLIPDTLYSLGGDDDDDDASDTAVENARLKAEAKKKEPEGFEAGYRFTMKDGELKIHSILDRQSPTEEGSDATIGAVDPFAEEPPAAASPVQISEAMKEQILAKLLADMRLGVFVEVDGEIESTSAIHRQGNLITLVSLNLGKILESPGAKQHMNALTSIKNTPNRRERIQELAKKIDGLDVDAQDPIVVKFQ